MTKIHGTHWMVRATCITLGAGAVLGIINGFNAMGSTASGSPVMCAVAVLIYLAIGAAAVGLWFGEDLGLQATRLLLVQIPLAQSASFSYLFYTGALGVLYGGSKFGLQGLVGSSFALGIYPGSASNGDYIVGVNLLAIAMLVILGRVDLLPSASPPPLPQSPS
ncbi:hypothetical protein [Rhodanobacter sp. Root179]|uniref:hypothetical protein n=1 Tax=Rhodanobacter sp. Root179 TaxID=1736482 RepID=UPI0012FC90E8|nr:hypothetical protein [Rhodanobacter sp. Root179]